IPHCKSNAVKFNSLVVLKPREPVVWSALDYLPVEVVILIATREISGANDHLRIFAKLSRQLMDERFRERLRNENNAKAICDFLRESLPARPAAETDVSR